MKFQYKKYGPGILRPVIPVVIKYNGKDIIYEALVDSGADSNIFPAQIADILGINVESGEKREAWGITGIGEDYYVHSVELMVGGWSYDIKVGFLPNIARLGYGILGQKGFFDIFVVKFDLLKGEIELKTR